MNKGCKINHVNDHGKTVLAVAMKNKKIEVACYLINRGANVNIGLPPDSDGLLFRALDFRIPTLIELLIPLHDVSRRSASGRTPLMVAAEKNLIEVAIPLIQATLKFPSAPQMRSEALAVATRSLFKELLINPSIVGDVPPSYSFLQADGAPVIMSAVIGEHVSSQYHALQCLQANLGSTGLMTPMQMTSAKISILTELPVWKLHHPNATIFPEELPRSLLPVREKVIAFIMEDIEVLATQALQWEENHLIPVVENLYESCLSHSLSQNPGIDILSELTVKGLYYPIAKRIANAWSNAWATMHEEAVPMMQPRAAAPMMQPAVATHLDDWDREDLGDLDPLTGEMVIKPDTVARNIDHFIDTPVGSNLLQAFRAALKSEFDSVAGGILRAPNTNLSEHSQGVYADLIGRQLHLVAQFWRAKS